MNRVEPGRFIDEITFNTYEVILDREESGARIFAVLDGNAEPLIVRLDERRRRLA